PSLCRAAMCVGKCNRIVGPSLLVLGSLSVAASILLLFPGGASKYLVEGHISKHAKAVPGIWGGGITVSTVVCVAPFLTCLWGKGGAGGSPLSSSSSFLPAFISAVLSKLALLGAAACFVLSGVGLTNGPLCLYNATEHGRRDGTHWGYPILHLPLSLLHRTDNYLYDRHTWSICLEPKGVVAWNVVLFSLLLLVSAAEMVLASLQVLNGYLGCLCGFCEGK
ncbi:T4S1 protein, partial [Todus mexicanus]|nr:T4S1 protein [Todus mexicanus]